MGSQALCACLFGPALSECDRLMPMSGVSIYIELGHNAAANLRSRSKCQRPHGFEI